MLDERYEAHMALPPGLRRAINETRVVPVEELRVMLANPENYGDERSHRVESTPEARREAKSAYDKQRYQRILGRDAKKPPPTLRSTGVSVG
jgi:hypothetical protein